MSSKSVAVDGDVTATPGTVFYTGADSGTWTAGTITYESYDKLTVTKKVIYKAICKFSFAGANSGTGATITGEETVTLEATPTLLQKGATSVLRDGDSQVGEFGNKLEVLTNNKLKSA